MTQVLNKIEGAARTPYELLKEIRSMNSTISQCGNQKNGLLNLSDESIFYIISLLREQHTHPPELTKQEWLRLISELRPHFILPLLYWKMRSLSDEYQPPRETFETLREAFLHSNFQNLSAERQLSDIIAEFKKEKVPLLVLKGAAFSHSLYPHPALRMFSDIDLLIQPQHFDESKNALKHLGYYSPVDVFGGFKDFYCDETFLYKDKTKNYKTVELHWNLCFYPGMFQNLQAEGLFERAVPLNLAKIAGESLSPVDELLHIATHSVLKHNDNIRLDWIYDVFLLSKKISRLAEWGLLQSRSVSWGARITVEKILKLAMLWMDFNPSDGISDFKTWPKPTEKETIAWSYISKVNLDTLSTLKLRWPTSAGFLEKIKLLFYLIFPPYNVLRAKYPLKNKYSIPKYYIIRWWKWILRCF